MTKLPVLQDIAEINRLAEKLARYACVSRFDKGGEAQAGVLAHAFSDLEASFHKIIVDLIPRLASEELGEREAREVLLEIGEEFRHIQYHIADCQFYRYLQAE